MYDLTELLTDSERMRDMAELPNELNCQMLSLEDLTDLLPDAEKNNINVQQCK